MNRHRLTMVAANLAGLAILLYIAVSLYLPSSRRMIVGVDKRTGKIRTVETSITFLPPDRYDRLAFDKHEGYAQSDGVITIHSKERIPLEITYRIRFAIEPKRLPDARPLVEQGWASWMNARVAEAVDAVTRQVPVEDLASPLSQFTRQRDRFARAVSFHLGRSGLHVTGFAIERIDVDRDALLRYKRAELRRNAQGAAINPNNDRARLEMIGHVIDPNRTLRPLLEQRTAPAAKPVTGAAWGLYAYYNNMGVQLRKQERTKEAIDAFNHAIEINPNWPVPYLNLAMILLDKEQYADGEDQFQKAVARGLPNAEKYFVDFAAFYRSQNMPSRAINLLIRGRASFPQSYDIAANLGSALAEARRYTDATAELERALAMRPTSTAVLNNLGLLKLKQQDYGRALDDWNRSLAIDPRQPTIRQGLAAAQSRM